MDYSTLKLIHVTCVVASGTGFALRATVSLIRPGRLPRRGLVHALPHVVDSVLLASALGMVWMSGGSLLSLAWLQAKIVLLVAYVVFGARALSRHRRMGDRLVSTAAAVASFIGIVASAMTGRVLGIG